MRLRKISQIGKTFVILLIVFAWIFVGWPRIWQKLFTRLKFVSNFWRAPEI